MGVVTYVGAESPADITISTGSVRVTRGVNYTFPDLDCSALLAQQPSSWLAGDQHTQTLLPPNYPVALPIASAAGTYDSTKTYMRGQVVVESGGAFLCLADNTLNVDPASTPATWLALGPQNPSSVVSATSLAGAYAGGGKYDTDTFANFALGSALPNVSPGLGSNAHGNTIIGSEWTGSQLSTGWHNVAIGSGAFGALNSAAAGGGGALTTAQNTIAIGDGALGLLTSGNANTIVGNSGGGAITTGFDNVGLGFGVLSGVTTANDNTALGHIALQGSTGSNNTAVGSGALAAGGNTASFNTAVGVSAGGSLTTGQLNVLSGYHAGTALTTGGSNTAVGYNALSALIANSNSTAVGVSALASSTGGQNTAVGSSAGGSVTTGIINTFVGQQAGFKIVAGNGNTHVGQIAGNNAGSADVSYSTGVGYNVTLGAQYALALGRNASATAQGAAAIGTDSTGAGAAVAAADTIALGTTKHVVLLAGAATASAPSYQKGGLYFDTTLNKLRVGGASAWETVTSA